jgi:hypothetical protein
MVVVGCERSYGVDVELTKTTLFICCIVPVWHIKDDAWRLERSFRYLKACQDAWTGFQTDVGAGYNPSALHSLLLLYEQVPRVFICLCRSLNSPPLCSYEDSIDVLGPRF